MPQYDIIIVGAGVSGLWLGNRLKREGYNVLVIENAMTGARAGFSQGLVAAGSPEMSGRWEACLGGWGDVDLASVSALSESRVLWPATPAVPGLAVSAMAKTLGPAEKTKPRDFPEALSFLQDDKTRKTRVYTLQDRALDTQSLVHALSMNLRGRILRGSVQELLPDGQIAVSGLALRAQLVVFTAGAGNARALSLMRVKERPATLSARRHVFVRPMPFPLHGHAVTEDLSPRVTVTSHALNDSEYLWHVAGDLAADLARMPRDKSLKAARAEMQKLFPHIDWRGKKWATRDHAVAEPRDGRGSFIHQRGRVLAGWTASLAFAPELADRVLAWMRDKDIAPASKTKPPALPKAEPAGPLWKSAAWKILP